jgi:NADPH:quinone reductase
MRVLETSKSEPGGLRFAERLAPLPQQGEVLIDVQHISLNLGEVRRAAMGTMVDGVVPGWDAAGVISAVGADTDAPPVGTCVVSRALFGGWAEKRVAHVDDIAVVPDGVEMATASTLPTAATTALAVLTRGGPLLGRTVLITGASGSVGRFAIQLAKIGGARVTASVSSEASAQSLVGLGADRVILGLEGAGGADLIVETLGGPTLVECLRLVNPGANVVNIGWSSRQQATFSDLGALNKGGTLHSFGIGDYRVGPYLRVLLSLLEGGKLTSAIRLRTSWDNFASANAAVMQRGYHGKVVLTLPAMPWVAPG